MFSYLSRGYGTWEGIAKLEKPDSAISDSFSKDDFVLPPINSGGLPHYEQTSYNFQAKIPQETFRLPEVPKGDSLPIPKTYSTKSGALLLYSEGCFIPGSRRLKKRPRQKRIREKEKRIQTLKDLTDLIMNYKKNEGDPLLLANLWRKANKSGLDVRPGFSPQRYLTHLGYTTLDSDAWKKLAETGSLKSLGTLEEDGFLPLLLQNPEIGDNLLHQRPQPYTTMSLPPVSPSSSMLGSFTFYKHGMSTGAASLVSMNSMTSESVEEYHLSLKTIGTHVESLSERLAEVDSESGFKCSYESLTPKEKEELLTQLIMDVTLHREGGFSPAVSVENTADSPVPGTVISNIAESKSSQSLRSVESSKTVKSPKYAKSVNSFESFNNLKLDKSSNSLKSLKNTSLKSLSKDSLSSSVCILPPIQPSEGCQDRNSAGSAQLPDTDFLKESLSDSGSGLTLTEHDLGIALDGIEVDIEDNECMIGEDGDIKLYENEASEKDHSEYSLTEALEIQEGDQVHQFNEEITSIKSLESSSRLAADVEGDEDHSKPDFIIDETSCDGALRDDDGSDGGDEGGSGHEVSGGDVASDDVSSYSRESGGQRNGGKILDGVTINQTSPNKNHELKTGHISLDSLQDEVRLVAEEVLSRPKSGRFLIEDAQMASALLMQRIEGLLAPAGTENIRVSSAVPGKVRPLGHPRNSQANVRSKNNNERTVTSAGPRMTSRSYASLTNVPAAQHEKQDVEDAVLTDDVEEKSDLEGKDMDTNDQNDIVPDDIIFTADEQKLPEEQPGELYVEQKESEEQPVEHEDPEEQSMMTASESPSRETNYLTVKDLKSTTQTEEEKPKDKATVKENKESVTKTGKGKKGGNIRKGNVGKGKKKKKSVVPSETKAEPPKTPPFRAGIAPEQKPPKGLDLKPDEAPRKESGNKVTLEAKMVEEEKEPQDEKLDEDHVIEPDIPKVVAETRVDSETGEIEHTESPVVSEKTPSPSEITSSVEETSVVENTPSPQQKTPSPCVESMSPRDQASSPQEKLIPEPKVVEESVVPLQQPEVPVVISERTRRANARAAQRAAAAERRRQEVERKRKEREEARKRAQEEEARLEVLRREAEEEMKRREEELRIQKEREEEERRRIEAEEKERARQEQLLAERQRATREEWKRKKEQLVAQRKLEDEMRKERERIEEQIEEERRREYEARIAHLEDEERERLMEERRLEEERIKREIEEERLKREEERRRYLEERRRMEEEFQALRERQLARQRFLESLLKEYQNLLLDQRVTRAFTFSYFDILPWFQETWDKFDEKSVSASLPTVREEEENEMEQIV